MKGSGRWSMLYIAVCDDEDIFVKKIEVIIKEYLINQQIKYQIDCFGSGEDFLKLNEKMRKYNIVFMDINMKNIDGIEVAKIMRKFSSDIFLIFVTAFINYTLEGYKVEAIRYILKDSENLSENVKEALNTVLKKMDMKKKVLVYDFVNVGMKSVSLNQIIYIENELHKLNFHFLENGMEKVYGIYKKLDEIEQDFDSEILVRIHQSFLININYVTDIWRYCIKLKNGLEIPISKQRYKQAKTAFINQKGEI